MRVLVACEESQVVTMAFRAKGHEAFSCDVIDCSGGHPEWHIKDDVLKHVDDGWDMMIAFPPCTYISNAGARFLYPKGILDNGRLELGKTGKKLFMKLINANIPKICIENPIHSKIFNIPKHTQQIQPYEFGHPVQKKTRLWLKNLPELVPTNIVNVKQSTKVPGNWFNKGGKERQKNRSKTFQGISEAMANQWG